MFIECCPLCGGLAQAQATRVMSRHKTGVPRTVMRNYRCKDPECLDLMGNPPSWRTSTEFSAWSALINYDPIKLIEKSAKEGCDQVADMPGSV